MDARGQTPFATGAFAGPHTVELALHGFRGHRQNLKVIGDETACLEVRTQPLPVARRIGPRVPISKHGWF